MLKKAKNKISKEVKEIGTNHAKLIGEYIIGVITSSDIAERVLKEDKKFATCLNKIKEKAREHQQNGMAVIEDEQVYSWALDYYNIEKASKNDLSVNLMDLL